MIKELQSTLLARIAPKFLVLFSGRKHLLSWFGIYTKLTSFRIVNFIVFLYRQYLQIFNPIISLYSIYVVDVFGLLKRSIEVNLHNMSMLRHSFVSTKRNVNISIAAKMTHTSSECSGKCDSTLFRAIFSDSKPLFHGTGIRFFESFFTNVAYFVHVFSIQKYNNVRNIKIKCVTIY